MNDRPHLAGRDDNMRQAGPAARSDEEYWIESVQSRFDCNREADTLVPQNHYANPREALEAYDLDSVRLIADVFCHSDRLDSPYQQYIERKAQ